MKSEAFGLKSQSPLAQNIGKLNPHSLKTLKTLNKFGDRR